MASLDTMGVDEAGYILCVPDQPLQPQYEAVVADACLRLEAALPQLLHSIYVYGSVAWGCARLGESDLDLTIVLQRAATKAEAAVLQQLPQALAADHAVVSKVDFDIGLLAEVMAPESVLRWGGWLKHYCRHLSGDDLALFFPKLKPTRALALALNGECMATLSSLGQALIEATAVVEIERLQRMTARQLLRATMVLRHDDDDGCWPQTLVQSVAMVVRHHPEQAEVWAYFLAQAQQPRADKVLFLAYLRPYLIWLRQVMA